MIVKSLMAAVACAALLAACSKPAADNTVAAANAPASPSAPTSNAVPAGPAGPMALADLPAPPAGLWRRVSSQDGGAPETSTKCMDGKPIDPTQGGPSCLKITAVRTATGGFVVDGDCPANGVEAKLRMAAEGDFKTSFTTDTDMAMSGGGAPSLAMKNHSVWTYVGACDKGG